MPPTRLPERPKPPTGQQMLNDIVRAPENDVVFLSGQPVDLSDLTPTTPDRGLEGKDRSLTQEALALADRREAAQRTYHQVVELLQRVKTLEDAPSQLMLRFQHLSELGDEMSKVIQDLQESSGHVTQTQSKKESKMTKTNKQRR